MFEKEGCFVKKAGYIFRRSLMSLLLLTVVLLGAPSVAAEQQVETIERNRTYTQSAVVTADYRVTRGNVDLKGKTLTVTGDFYLDNGTVKLSGGTLNIGGNLYVTGDLYVSNGKLNVAGNVIHKDGKVDIGMGHLTVEQNYYMATPKTLEDGELFWDSCRGDLVMRWPADKLTVKGDFLMNAAYGVDCTGGTLTVGGDFTQLESYKPQKFFGEKKHKVVLNGKELQTVTFENPSSRFGRLEVANPAGIKVTDYFAAAELTSANRAISIQSDNAVFGDLGLNVPLVSIEGNVLLQGDVNLKYYNLKISGDLIHTDGTMNAEWGVLDVAGNYYIAAPQTNEAGEIVWGSSHGILSMTYPRSTVNVSGDYVMNTGRSSSLTAGKLTVSGDFIQQVDYTPKKLLATNTHKVILNGKEQQTVALECSGSGFAVLEVANPAGILVTNHIRANSLTSPTGLVKIQSQNAILEGLNLDVKQLTVTGDLIQEGDVHLKSNNMTVEGNLLVKYGEVKAYSGKLTVTGKTSSVSRDFTIQAEPYVVEPPKNDITAYIGATLGGAAVDHSNQTVVYVTRTGSRFHRDPGCGGIKEAIQTTLAEARQMGLDACENCY